VSETEATGEAPRRPHHLVLIGLPGVGKTTVGRALARRLHRRFVDMDAEIEQLFGKSVSRIFAQDGEAAFRAAEAMVSARLASTDESLVIAPGGGWVMNESARAHLRGLTRIIYLRVSPDEAARRMGRGVARRPLLASGDAVSTLRALHDRRREAYEAVADVTVETADVPRGEVVARVLRLVTTGEQDHAPDDGPEAEGR
jgi:shikimate kinase